MHSIVRRADQGEERRKCKKRRDHKLQKESVTDLSWHFFYQFFCPSFCTFPFYFLLCWNSSSSFFFSCFYLSFFLPAFSMPALPHCLPSIYLFRCFFVVCCLLGSLHSVTTAVQLIGQKLNAIQQMESKTSSP